MDALDLWIVAMVVAATAALIGLAILSVCETSKRYALEEGVPAPAG
jgi:hypothetical protein